MKQIFLTIPMAFIFSMTLWAQGIQFEEGSWSQILEKAKKANKPIYLDVYTTWCGPCKYMAATFFPNAEIGAYFNTQFINYKIDAEKGEGIEIAETYKVRAYPTNIFIDPHSKQALHTVVGVPAGIHGFLDNGKFALSEFAVPIKEYQYDSVFNTNKYDEAFLLKYLASNKRLEKSNEAALDAYLKKFYNKQIKAGKPLPREVLETLLTYQSGVTNYSFSVLQKYKYDIDAYYGIPGVHEILEQQYLGIAVQQAISNKDLATFQKLITYLPDVDKIDPLQTKFMYEQNLYNTIKQTDSLYQSQVNYATLIVNRSEEEIKSISDRKNTFTINNAKYQAFVNKHTSEQLEATLKEITENDYYINATRNNIASQLNMIGNTGVFLNQKKDHRAFMFEMKSVEQWLSKAWHMVESSKGDMWYNFGNNYTTALIMNLKLKEALAVQDKIIARAKETNYHKLKEHEDIRANILHLIDLQKS